MKPSGRGLAYLHQVRSDGGDHGRVSLHHGREAHLQLGFGVARSLHDVMGLLTPGDKVLVLFHVGHHVVHLLHGKAAAAAGVRRPSGGNERPAAE